MTVFSGREGVTKLLKEKTEITCSFNLRYSFWEFYINSLTFAGNLSMCFHTYIYIYLFFYLILRLFWGLECQSWDDALSQF